MNWVENPMTPVSQHFCSPETKRFKSGNLNVLVSQEPDGMHLSISHPHRYPSWDEIKSARYDLLPSEKTFAMILPPPGDYVNIHENCFHLYELKENPTT